MKSRLVFVSFVVIIVAASIGLAVSQGHAPAESTTLAHQGPMLAQHEAANIDIEWSVLGVVLGGIVLYLLRPRKRTVENKH